MTKVAAISGATGYVGQAIARQLASDGLTLALWCRDAEKGSMLLKELGGTGHRAYVADLTDSAAVADTFAAMQTELGIPFAAIHAAGVAPTRKKLTDSTGDEVEEQLRGNALAGFNFLSICANAMRQDKRGVLIGITTAALSSDGSGLGPYVPAKAALKSILALFSEELKPFNIQVHEIAPGFMEAGMNASLPRAFVEMVRQKAPEQKLMTAEDVAAQVSEFVSAKV